MTDWLGNAIWIVIAICAVGGLAVVFFGGSIFGRDLEHAYMEYLPDSRSISELSDDQIERITTEWRRVSVSDAYRSGRRLLVPYRDHQGLEQLEAAAEERGGALGLVESVTTAYLATTYQYVFEDLDQFRAMTAAWTARRLSAEQQAAQRYAQMAPYNAVLGAFLAAEQLPGKRSRVGGLTAHEIATAPGVTGLTPPEAEEIAHKLTIRGLLEPAELPKWGTRGISGAVSSGWTLTTLGRWAAAQGQVRQVR